MQRQIQLQCACSEWPCISLCVLCAQEDWTAWIKQWHWSGHASIVPISHGSLDGTTSMATLHAPPPHLRAVSPEDEVKGPSTPALMRCTPNTHVHYIGCRCLCLLHQLVLVPYCQSLGHQHHQHHHVSHTGPRENTAGGEDMSTEETDGKKRGKAGVLWWSQPTVDRGHTEEIKVCVSNLT